MSWQQCGEKRYYYRNEWRDGRSVRTYLGTGAIGELAATADALQRLQRGMKARQWRNEQERRATAQALLDELCEQSDLLFRATLVVAGFRQHQRGAWRRTRVKPIPD